MIEQLLTDPREMRVMIRKFGLGRNDLKGDSLDWGKVIVGSAMVRNCMEHARRTGFSGEDLYTMIAYHALLTVQSMGEQLIDQANMRTVYILQKNPPDALTPEG